MIISNGSGVIMLTDRQKANICTNTQTDTTKNNTTLAAWVAIIINGSSVSIICAVEYS